MVHAETIHHVDLLGRIEHGQRERGGAERAEPLVGEHAPGHGPQRIKNRGEVPFLETRGCKMGGG